MKKVAEMYMSRKKSFSDIVVSFFLLMTLKKALKNYMWEKSLWSDVVMTLSWAICILYCYFSAINVTSFIVVTITGITGTARWICYY